MLICPLAPAFFHLANISCEASSLRCNTSFQSYSLMFGDWAQIGFTAEWLFNLPGRSRLSFGVTR